MSANSTTLHDRATTRRARSSWAGLMRLASGQERLMALTIVATVLAQGGMVATLATCAWLIGHAVTGAGAAQWQPGLGCSPRRRQRARAAAGGRRTCRTNLRLR